jgi:hypothetical protein
MVADAMIQLGCELPEQICFFYRQMNGLKVEDPSFDILPIQELEVDESKTIHFATADGDRRICFDCSRLNEAGQWDIIDATSGYRITLTMASFWSNKIWKWIDRRRAFWVGEH